ncbi:hypothetical protein RUM44_006576 [Polyplax serrata]|uniref:Uncharacterized protein n=1 Tax=Polyplax serrata TaxID=468196 RepID=A0ABR1AII1_POLSC
MYGSIIIDDVGFLTYASRALPPGSSTNSPSPSVTSSGVPGEKDRAPQVVCHKNCLFLCLSEALVQMANARENASQGKYEREERVWVGTNPIFARHVRQPTDSPRFSATKLKLKISRLRLTGS